MKDIKEAFQYSIPVFFTYLLLGIGFGVVISEMSLHWLWAFFSSVFIFSGSGQYLILDFLSDFAPIYTVILLFLLVNVRYSFYGISFVNKFKPYKWYEKLYLFFGLTDETYSILVAHSLLSTKDTRKFDLWLTLFNQSYWILGSVIGTLLGKLPFDFTGIDFSMTALFTIILVDQLRNVNTPHLASVIGAGSAVLSYLIFGGYFVFPAIALIIVLIFVFRKRIESQMGAEDPLPKSEEAVVEVQHE